MKDGASKLIRNTIIGLICFNVLIITMTIFALNESKRSNKLRAQNSVDNLSISLEHQIADSFNKIDIVLQSIMNEALNIKKSAAPFKHELYKQRTHLQIVTGLSISDEKGNIVYDLEKSRLKNTNISNLDYFITLRKNTSNKLFIFLPEHAQVNGQWIIILARRLENSNGSFAGVIWASIPIQYYQNLFSSLKLGAQGSIALRDKKMRLIARHPPLTKTGQSGSIQISDDFKSALKSTPDFGNYIARATSVDGIRRLHSYRFNSFYEFYINVGSSKDDYLAEWRKYKIQMILFLSFILIISILFVIYLRKFLSLLEVSSYFFQESQHAAGIGSYKLYFTTGKWEASEVLDIVFGIEKTFNRDVPGWLSLIHPDDREMMNSYLNEEVIAQGKTFSKEYRIIRNHDHQIRWVNGLGKVIRSDKGMLLFLIGTIQDITERKLIEHELQNAKLIAEAANKTKSVFLASMSHELRTPLNGVLGFVQLLELDDVSPKHREYLNYISQSGKILLALINDILDLSKIEAKKITLENSVFNIKSCVEEIMLIQNLKAKGKNIFLNKDISADLDDFYMGDSFRLKQILNNFVSNSIKFTKVGGIQIAVNVIAKNTHSDVVQFSVSDTGIGMTQEALTIIFQPFMQADSSISREYGGTGLGLSISKRLVELMGGAIKVESIPNKGSRFSFEIVLLKE